MTIGIDASRAGKKEKTGTEWYSHHLLRSMSMLPSEHEFRLYIKDSIPFALPKNWHERRLAWPFDYFWPQGGLSLEMFTAAPDVLFVPSHAVPVIHPRCTVTTIHDIGFHDSPHYRSKKEREYLEWSTRYALRHCSKIITISEFTKRELVRVYDARESQISVVYLGVDTQFYAQEVEEDEMIAVRDRYHLTNPYLLFVGRIDSRKNVGRLIQAFEMLKQHGHFDGNLVLAGPIGFDGQAIIDSIASSPYAESIHYLGWISEDEKRVLMRAAYVFVFPSLYEGCGMPVVEAQLCGIPVVCSNTTSLPEVAGGGAVYVDPSKVSDIARGVQESLHDTALRNDYIMKGYENARRFSWERCAQETMHILEQCATRSL